MAGLGFWLRGLFGGKVEPDPGSPVPQGRVHAGGPASFADGNNDFALAMYGQLGRLPGNLFFSPFSIRAALAMTLAGARGETAAQMSETLRTSSSDEMLHVDLAEIIQRLEGGGGGEQEMAVANSLWSQDGAPVLPAFADLIARHYRGGVNLVDFRHAAETARVRINHWVEDNTKQRIRELIPPGGVDGTTRLVLVNAVYFKGKWTLQFERSATRDGPFRLQGGDHVSASMMHQCEEILYSRFPGYQAVDLVYQGGDRSMLVLLPDRKDGLPALEQTLSVRMLHDCVAHMSPREVNLFLPKFKLTWGTVDIRDPLEKHGLTLPFSRSAADFSGVNGYRAPQAEALFISSVYHQAFVEVSEEGTEAAAATAVSIVFAAAEPPFEPPVPVFCADHPFLFAIRDRKSGAILFLGRVADPTRNN